MDGEGIENIDQAKENCHLVKGLSDLRHLLAPTKVELIGESDDNVDKKEKVMSLIKQIHLDHTHTHTHAHKCFLEK